MSLDFRIKLFDKIFTYDQYRQNEQFVSKLLARAHANKTRAKCLCNGHFAELYVFGRNKQYYLAKMQDTGSMHDPRCTFYESPAGSSGKANYTTEAIVEEEGLVTIKLGTMLKRDRELKEATETKPPSASPSTYRRSSVGLLGLLHYLWERSKNNHWFPEVKGREITYRSWSHCHYFLNQTLEDIVTKGTRMANVLFVVPEFDKSSAESYNRQFEQFIAPVIKSGTTEAKERKQPIEMKLLLGEIKALTRNDFGYQLKLKQTTTTIYLRDEFHQKISRSYPLAMAALQANQDYRVITLVKVSASAKGYLQCEDIAFMPVSKNYIPIDSSYERIMSDLLVQEKRHFEKPLRYEASEMVLPDFVLLDCEGQHRVPCEIYGMTGNPDYEARKKEKRSIYRATNEMFWEWEPALSERPPPLPEKRKSK